MILIELDVVIKKVNLLIEFFEEFKETWVSKAIDDAKEL